MSGTGDQSSSTKHEHQNSIPQPAPIDSQSLNLPNLITLSRFVLAIILFYIIYVERLWITAAVVFIVAACTDFADGYIARRYGLVTTLGRILDPFVDKIIVCGAFIFLLEKKEFDSGVNAWMVVIVVGREMYVTSLRAFLEQHGRDFSASWSGKIKMAVQCVAVTASLLSLSPQFDSSAFYLARDVTLWSAVAITAYSGWAYTHRAIRMLRPPATG